jgi:hypothetical protein
MADLRNSASCIKRPSTSSCSRELDGDDDDYADDEGHGGSVQEHSLKLKIIERKVFHEQTEYSG